ncbi:beta-N-acetylhexosaminidase [Celerinatantimonas yamalensis]|uniref:Beta-hexosaminidase n=1 Tax=Celerinatantimonas yamalensis TaxID=559956 RepID=A0ABW9G3N5_9GAMM
MGPLFIDLNGVDVSAIEREILAHPLVAGVILFSRNYQDRQQLCDLVRLIRESRAQPLLIVTDQEGGRVQRFRQQFSAIPAAGQMYHLAQQLSVEPLHYAQELGWLMASELRACDIDLSLAPVLDIDGMSHVIGNRAFADNPEGVVAMAQAFIFGMRDAHMCSVGKHFPGHGSVQADSHIAQVIDTRSFEQIESHDLIPFLKLIRAGLLDALMPAHVIYPNVSSQPAGFSQKWLQTILRQRYGYQGLIFSDDLSMQAAHIAGTPLERANLALAAGCDLLLACNDRQSTEQLLDGLDHQCISHDKALQLCPQGKALNWTELSQSPRYQRLQRWLS